VLVLCVGVATRLTEYVQRMDKAYRAGLRLGACSDTDDADGNVVAVAGVSPPQRDDIDVQLRGFLGEIRQVPPAFSAAKVTGRRAYALARRGEEVTLEPRTVHIHGIDVLRYDYPHLELEVRCGKGTYIRALARDLGERLGCGALIESLRRTRVGRFTVDEALPLQADAVTARSRLRDVAEAVCDLPRCTLTGDQVHRLRQGQQVVLSPTAFAFPSPRCQQGPSTSSPEPAECAAFDAAGKLVGVVCWDPARSSTRPVKVLHVRDAAP
jgi:tRNA pseudouridine55 synthase